MDGFDFFKSLSTLFAELLWQIANRYLYIIIFHHSFVQDILIY